ncbi:arylacetamide deacetylase-like 4 [Erpetoichthys calabaricus]|uniref:Arylacetamide deacetylase-like 4 n=1 Tax=Erpetoichthys calabaricus TaxID=27687 RepID=A0A8C4X898_ERPCA|nr:arylacetamide deacetylase-like 4 [Erpetoichthys calabaricus]
MEMFIAIALLCVVFLLSALILLFFGVLYSEMTNSEIPPGVSHVNRLHFIHGANIGIAILGKILENFSLCEQVNFTRYCRERLLVQKKPVPPELHIKDLLFSDVPVRVYLPTAPTAAKRRGLVFFHGGGWMFGSLDSYDHICRYVAIHSETVVVSVAYRLSPEHRYPVQLDDCQAATLHFLKVAEADYGVDPRKVALGGDSAGGNLAAALCYRAAKEGARPQPCAQILIYPLLQMADFHLPSYQQNKMVPMLFRGRTIFYCLQYLNGDMTLNEEMLNSDHVPVELKLRYRKWLGHENLPSECKARGFSLKVASSHDEEVYDLLKQALEPELSPLLAPDDVVRKLPPAFILTCEYDVLRDDGILFKKRLEDLGVPVTWHHINDGFHGILNFFDGGRLNFPSGKRAIDHVVDFLRTL